MLVLVVHVVQQDRAERTPRHDIALLVLVVGLLVIMVSVTLVRQGRLDASAVADIAIADPIDGWIGGAGGLDGDLELAQGIAGDGVSVRISETGDALVFKAVGSDSQTNQRSLAQVLATFEAARQELRDQVEARLDYLPSLERLADRRGRHELVDVAEWWDKIEGSWRSTPLSVRLESLDVVLSEAFWEVAASDEAGV